MIDSIFELNGKTYAFQPSDGAIIVVDPALPIDTTNPAICRRPLVTDAPLEQLNLEITTRCNLRCIYCPHTVARQGHRRHGEKSMDLATAIKAVDLLIERAPKEPVICFYGGEPMINFPLIKDVVEYCEGQGFDCKFKIDTNGTLIRSNFGRWARDHNIDWQISLDGPEKINDAWRKDPRGGGTYHKVLLGYCNAALDDLFSLKKPDPSNVRFMVTLAWPYDIETVADYFQHVSQVGVTFVDYEGTGFKISTDFTKLLAPFREQYIEACKAGTRDKLSPVITGIFDGPLITLAHRRRGECSTWCTGGCCDPGVRRLYVRADGRLQPCEKLGERHVIGSVAAGIDWSRVDAMHEEFFESRQQLGCQDCWALRLCGGCWAQSEPDCDKVRKNWIGWLRLYTELCEAGAAGWLEDTEVA